MPGVICGGPLALLLGSDQVDGTVCAWGHLYGVGLDKREEGLHGDHPGGDGGAEVLPQEGPQRDILPRLDVPSWEKHTNKRVTV